MKVCGYGCIVNICSCVIFGSFDCIVYFVVKNVLVGCMCMWVFEFVEYGVIVNVVVFGLIEIELFC